MELKAVKTKLHDGFGNDLLSDVSISNLMQETTSKLISDFYEKRKKNNNRAIKRDCRY